MGEKAITRWQIMQMARGLIRSISASKNNSYDMLCVLHTHLFVWVPQVNFHLLGDLVLLGDDHAGNFFNITEVQGLEEKEICEFLIYSAAELVWNTN